MSPVVPSSSNALTTDGEVASSQLVDLIRSIGSEIGESIKTSLMQKTVSEPSSVSPSDHRKDTKSIKVFSPQLRSGLFQQKTQRRMNTVTSANVLHHHKWILWTILFSSLRAGYIIYSHSPGLFV
ncbi:hypothetical protein AMECASPLE_011138 [Ameca splendens]|uniref:Uncharacterized protein n=1 Tax=Ameca splendens TaxID=208324 RepID=A0ABV0ZXJ2_9TELE